MRDVRWVVYIAIRVVANTAVTMELQFCKVKCSSNTKKTVKNSIRRNERGFIILGSATDPYPTVEKDLKLTREILGIIKCFRFPLHLLTKSTMLTRDIDILKGINEVAILPSEFEDKLDCGVIISFSFSTLNEEIARILEPGAPSPIKRLETMKEFNDAGFKTGIITFHS